MNPPLLEVQDLLKRFPVRHGLTRRLAGHVTAVDGVSLRVEAGETLGVVGESGCGKSTVARLITRLIEPTSGTIRVAGRELASMDEAAMRPVRRDLQMIFQDPFSSLNPRKTVRQILAAPFRYQGLTPDEPVEHLLKRVELRPEHADRFPHELSGGQAQRIGIARALALRPKLVICDEPVSALDVSIQAQIINLLADLQKEFDLTYVFISHDLSVVRHVSDRIAVMYLGKIVELAPTGELFGQTRHPYTRALLSALPVADPDTADSREQIILGGDIPSATNPPAGCRFHTRCPKARLDCAAEEPVLEPVLDDRPEHRTACFYPLTVGEDLSTAVPDLRAS